MYRSAIMLCFAILVCLASTALTDVPKLINYQGKLTTADGGCLNDTVQMTFSIYSDTLVSPANWTETQTSVIVKEGIFNVLLGSVDSIPASVFDGSMKYLGVQVESDQEMRPLKPIVSVAYAYKSREADTAGYAHVGDDDWTFRVTDGADTTLITGGGWGITRYGNALYGNADSTHVNLGVACTTGTSGQNYKYCTVGGGQSNSASGYSATVGGGSDNTASENSATIGGGDHNTANGGYATIGGGDHNTASGWFATAAGGRDNIASSYYVTVSGGHNNNATLDGAAIGGGYSNYATYFYATIGGGEHNIASARDATIGGGGLNGASGYGATVGGGRSNGAGAEVATIGGEQSNSVSAYAATVTGGAFNSCSGQHATVGGGNSNTASGESGAVGGGDHNTASGYYATVPGGYANTSAGDCSFAAGDSVRVDSLADYTFAFGANFTTSTPHVVIFMM